MMNKKITLLLVFIISIAGIVGGLYLWQKMSIPETSDKQRSADLKKVLGRDARESATTPSAAQDYSNDYFSLKLPPGAKRYAADNKDLESSEEGSLKKKDPLLIENMSFDIYEPRLTFVTSVRKMPPGSKKIDEVSGVTLRKNSPKIYMMEKISKNGQEGLVFTKKEPDFEKTAFFPVKDKIITISATATSFSDDALTVFGSVLDSFEIK